MRVRVVREAIRVRIIKAIGVVIIAARIAVRSIIGIAVRVMTANYRIVEVVRLVGIIVSGAEGIAPATQAHTPLRCLSSLRTTRPLLSITSSSSS